MKNYHKNPRQIKDKQFANLRAWLAELGDLSGIVHDLNTDEVISGNQRMRAIDIARCEVQLTEGPHDPELLDRVDAIWELKNGSLQIHPPGFAAYAQRIIRFVDGRIDSDVRNERGA